MKKYLKKLIIISIVVITLFVGLIIAMNYYIKISTKDFIYSFIENIPVNKTAVVLGTSKYTKKGSPNPYFYGRIAAAELLYKSGKVKYIIVSGDNRHKSYNEPLMMKNELNRRNIPDSVIFLDYAGLRTFDSVLRTHKIFGQQNFTIVSQRFQLERALFIARCRNIKAIGFEAIEVPFPYNVKTMFRENFARILMLYDLITLQQPENMDNTVIIP